MNVTTIDARSPAPSFASQLVRASRSLGATAHDGTGALALRIPVGIMFAGDR